MSLLIKNGTVVTDVASAVRDVRCAEGKIVEVGSDLEPAGEEILDASGQYVLPGGVDPHVHMSLPVSGTVSSDDFESGTAAGLAGGTTTIIDFVHPEQGQDPIEALRLRQSEAEVATCDYGLHMAVTWWGDRMGESMAECVAAGVPSFKVYTAYKATVGLDDVDLVQVLQTVADLNALTLVHAEHGEMIEHLRDRFAAQGKLEPKYHAQSRPSPLEGEATGRIAALAGAVGARVYVVHVTCRESAEAIAEAQRRGWSVHGETCPQYLLLDDSVYERPGFEGAAYVLAPPIRPRGHQEALWKALDAGTLESIGTDHCPFNMEGQKELGRDDFRLIPGGAPGIEHRLALLFTHGVASGRFDVHRFVDLVSTRPARLFGLYPRKGSITGGADADLVIWDPKASGSISAKTHRHRCDRSIYEGFDTVGAPSVVVAAGKVRFLDGDLRAERGSGDFLKRRFG